MRCSHAIYSVKAVVDYYTNRGTTVNLCALYLKKAFDKMNHFGLCNMHEVDGQNDPELFAATD